MVLAHSCRIFGKGAPLAYKFSCMAVSAGNGTRRPLPCSYQQQTIRKCPLGTKYNVASPDTCVLPPAEFGLAAKPSLSRGIRSRTAPSGRILNDTEPATRRAAPAPKAVQLNMRFPAALEALAVLRNYSGADRFHSGACRSAPFKYRETCRRPRPGPAR